MEANSIEGASVKVNLNVKETSTVFFLKIQVEKYVFRLVIFRQGKWNEKNVQLAETGAWPVRFGS